MADKNQKKRTSGLFSFMSTPPKPAKLEPQSSLSNDMEYPASMSAYGKQPLGPGSSTSSNATPSASAIKQAKKTASSSSSSTSTPRSSKLRSGNVFGFLRNSNSDREGRDSSSSRGRGSSFDTVAAVGGESGDKQNKGSNVGRDSRPISHRDTIDLSQVYGDTDVKVLVRMDASSPLGMGLTDDLTVTELVSKGQAAMAGIRPGAKVVAVDITGREPSASDPPPPPFSPDMTANQKHPPKQHSSSSTKTNDVPSLSFSSNKLKSSSSSSSLSSLQEGENENGGGGEDPSQGKFNGSFLPVLTLKEFTSAVETCKEANLSVMVLFSEKRVPLVTHLSNPKQTASQSNPKEDKTVFSRTGTSVFYRGAAISGRGGGGGGGGRGSGGGRGIATVNMTKLQKDKGGGGSKVGKAGGKEVKANEDDLVVANNKFAALAEDSDLVSGRGRKLNHMNSCDSMSGLGSPLNSAHQDGSSPSFSPSSGEGGGEGSTAAAAATTSSSPLSQMSDLSLPPPISTINNTTNAATSGGLGGGVTSNTNSQMNENSNSGANQTNTPLSPALMGRVKSWRRGASQTVAGQRASLAMSSLPDIVDVQDEEEVQGFLDGSSSESENENETDGFKSAIKSSPKKDIPINPLNNGSSVDNKASKPLKKTGFSEDLPLYQNGHSSTNPVGGGSTMVSPTQAGTVTKKESMKMRSKSILRPRGFTKDAPSVKSVHMGSAKIRFYDYDIGGSVPGITKGAPLGLGSNWQDHEEVELSIDELEEFRGGNIPEDDEEDEEWNDNWRVPREYFADEGTIPVARREELLKEAGHRRPSIDLLTQETLNIIKSRKFESGTLVSSLILAGFDIDEIYQLDLEEAASSKIGIWSRKILAKKHKALHDSTKVIL